MYCTKCGAKLDEDALFCSVCGTPRKAVPDAGVRSVPPVYQAPTVLPDDGKLQPPLTVLGGILLILGTLMVWLGAPLINGGVDTVFYFGNIYGILNALEFLSLLVLGILLFVGRRLPVSVLLFLLAAILFFWAGDLLYNGIRYDYLGEPYEILILLRYLCVAPAFVLGGVGILDPDKRKGLRTAAVCLLGLAAVLGFADQILYLYLIRYSIEPYNVLVAGLWAVGYLLIFSGAAFGILSCRRKRAPLERTL